MEKKAFRRKLMGYSAKQVQEAMKAQKKQEEEALEEKQTRLLELRDENLQLKKELEYFRSREQDVAAALLEAQSQARQMMEQAREAATREQERVRGQVGDLRTVAAENRKALEQVAADVMDLANDFVAHVAACSQQLKKLEEEPARPLRMNIPASPRRGAHKASAFGLEPLGEGLQEAAGENDRGRGYA